MRRDVFISTPPPGDYILNPDRVHVARSARHGHRKHAQSVGDGSHSEERSGEDALAG